MEEIARETITMARQLSSSGCFSNSFDLYLMAFEKSADMKIQHEQEFREVLTRLNEVLAAAGKMEDIFHNFERALDEFPDHVHYLNDIGKYLYKFEFYNEAWLHFHRALRKDFRFVNAEKNLNSVKNLLVERWHFRMLNDKVRNDAYRIAIRQTLIPIEDIVLDLGTGTGLLSLYANECSPISVTACDGSEIMASLAEDILKENGCTSVTVVHKMSTSMDRRDIPGKCSLLVTEMFDAGLFGEHILQALSHAWENLISNNGRVIPNKAEFFVIGAKCDYLNQKYQLCSDIKSLLKVPHLNVHMLSYDETYDCEDVHLIKDIKYMTEPQSVIKIDFNNYDDIQDKLNRTNPYVIELKAVDNGEINIVIGWFNLYLTDEYTITTDPKSEKRANAWQQPVFFDYIPKLVKDNDIVNIDFLVNGGKLTILQENGCCIHRISPETIRFLNDSDYMKLITGCIGMACVYLGQISEMSQTSIIDLCPFPMFGLHLLKRGAQSLICYAKTSSDKQFFKNVFKVNDIPRSKVTILVGEDWSQDVFKDEKYHAIFCNTLELCGEIDLRFNAISHHLKQNHLVPGGLFLPANVKLIGQVVSSDWLDINNRVYDANVTSYKLSSHINNFQVSQNFNIDFTHLQYTAFTKAVVLGNCSGTLVSEAVNMPVIQSGVVNAVLCWYSIDLMGDLKLSTNRSNSFLDGIVFLIYPKVVIINGKFANILRCVDPDGSFKCMIDVEATYAR